MAINNYIIIIIINNYIKVSHGSNFTPAARSGNLKSIPGTI